jgi:pyrroline-5-carboxylate reductase
LATGWVRAGLFGAGEIPLTRRDSDKLHDLAESGHPVGSDNAATVRSADVIVLAVQPSNCMRSWRRSAPRWSLSGIV